MELRRMREERRNTCWTGARAAAAVGLVYSYVDDRCLLVDRSRCCSREGVG